ncbi:MAG TPA: hypothetical protein VMQ76_10410 [Terracidiphilus sp.]|jgi:hypothetical protein|nr:hypothetical protein [Terracidiphilus sp.]
MVGPHREDVTVGPVRVILFGPKAAQVAQSPEVQAELSDGTAKGQAWALLPVEGDQNWGAASTLLRNPTNESNRRE